MTDQQAPDVDDFDRQVGANVSALRKARQMTQEGLAEAAEIASQRGVSLRQQTIVKIEKGTRPLRLREADALAGALGVSVDELLARPGPSFDDTIILIRATERVYERAPAVSESVQALMEAMSSLRRHLDRIGDDSEVPQHVLNEAHAATKWDPIKLARLGLERWVAAQGERRTMREAEGING